MEIKSSKIETSASNPKFYPSTDLCEIALAGRSNVGKSSLINTLLNRKDLARVSGSPGKTRVINFYLVNEQFYLVDLPGYGYARLSKAEKDSFSKTMEDYFTKSKNLKHVFLLVDVRHEPKSLDKQMYDYCKYYNIPCDVIATKADKISKGKYQQALKVIRNFLNMEKSDKVFFVSNLKKTGVKEVLDYFDIILGGN